MKWVELLIGWVLVLIVVAVGGILLLAMYAQAASVILSLVASAGVVGVLCLIFAPIAILIGWLLMLWERRGVLKKGWRLLRASWALALAWVAQTILEMLKGTGWTLLAAAGWLVLVGGPAAVLWALLEKEWWVLAFALPPTAGSWCMRLWIVRQKW
jgi:hypothetical protein